MNALKSNQNSDLSFIADHRYSVLGAFLASGVILGLAWTVGPRVICTEWMLGNAWFCFTMWFAAAIIASPLRVRRAKIKTQFFHGAVAVFVWIWFAVAIYPADLFSRHDVVWMSYFTSALGIVLWKSYVHRMLLRLIVRGALKESAACPWLRSFIFSLEIKPQLESPGLNCKCLKFAASIRSSLQFRTLHMRLYGEIGVSQICVEEVQRATDVRVRALRNSLALNDSAVICDNAKNAGDAFECESMICSSTANKTGEEVKIDVAKARALLVFESLLFAWLLLPNDAKCKSGIAAFESGVSNWEPFASIWSQSAEQKNVSRLLELDEKDLLSFSADRQGDAFQNFLVGISYVCRCIQLRYFRLANATLERISREFSDFAQPQVTNESFLRNEAQRIAHALGAECARAVLRTTDTTPHPSDCSQEALSKRRLGLLQAGRKQDMDQHGLVGKHPGLAPESDSNSEISTERAGYFSAPKNPKEVGRGFATVVLAIFTLSLGFSYLAWMPITNRIQHFFDVPSFSLVNSDEIIAQAIVEPTSILLIADKEDGLRTINLESFYINREVGKPNTGPGGYITKLATSPSGTAFAIFNTDDQHAPGVSARSLDAKWKYILSPSSAQIEGANIAALVPDFGRPIFLLASGEKRIAEYDETNRALCFAKTSGPMIEGIIADTAGVKKNSTNRAAVVATNSPSARVYLLTSTSDNGEISILEFPSVLLNGDRIASSIAIASDGTTILICKDGSAWEANAEHPTREWKQIRGGDQGLALDGIQLVGVAPIRKELWLFRGDKNGTTVWVRSLTTNSIAPGHGAGWAHCNLPATSDSIIPGRTMFCELSGNEGVILVTPACAVQPKGSAIVLRIKQGSAMFLDEPRNVLREGLKIVDVDKVGGSLIALGELDVDGKPGVTNRSLFRFGEIGKPSGTAHQLTSSLFENQTKQLLDSNNISKIVAVGIAGERNIIFLNNGKFVRFDGEKETLDWASKQEKSTVGTLNLNSEVVDGVIRGPKGSERVVLLGKDGSVEEGLIGETDVVSVNRLIENHNGNPSAEFLKEASGIFADVNHFTIASKEKIFTYNLQNALKPWTTTETQFDGAPLFGMDSAAAPCVISNSKVLNEEVSSFNTAGEKFAWAAPGVSQLQLGAGVAAFGLESDTLFSFDPKQGKVLLFKPTSHGPPEVIDVSVRPTHLDFLSKNSLHSFSLKDGDWSSSNIFENGMSLKAGGTRESPILFLIPEQSGIPLVLESGEPASNLRKLGNTSLRDAIAINDGVIGLTGKSGNGITFSRTDGTTLSLLKNTEDETINVDSPNEVVAFNEAFWFRGNTDLYRYTPSTMKTERVKTDGRNIDEIEGLKTSSLFAKSGDAILTFNSGKINTLDSFSIAVVGELHSMGRPYNGVIPAITKAGALWQVSGKITEQLLASNPPEQPIGIIDRVIADINQLYVYSENKVFSRSSDGRDPFKLIQNLTKAPTRVLFREKEIWLESPDGWTRQSPVIQGVNNPAGVVSVGKSIGWWPDGTLLTINPLKPAPLFSNNAPTSLFLGAPENFGSLRGFHMIDNGQVLILGNTSIATFDPGTRSFNPIKDAGPGFGSGVEVYEISKKWFLKVPFGEVYELVHGQSKNQYTLKPIFGKLRMSSIGRINNDFVGLSEGVLYTSSGEKILNQQSPIALQNNEVWQVLKNDRDSMYRLWSDGSVDRFDISVSKQNDISKDVTHIGTRGKDVIFCKLDGSVVDVQNRNLAKNRIAKDAWFGGRDFTLCLNDEIGLTLLTEDQIFDGIVHSEVIPGEVIAHATTTATVLCKIREGAFQAYDLFYAKKVGGEIRGQFVGVTKDGFYFLDFLSKVLTRIDPSNGASTVSEPAEKILVSCTDKGNLDAFALIQGCTSRIDPITLRLQSSNKVQSRFGPMSMVNLDMATTLLVGSNQFVLNVSGNKEANESKNPFMSSELKVYRTINGVAVSNKFGFVEVAKRDGERWVLTNSQSVTFPNPDLFKADKYEELPIKTEMFLVHVSDGTLDSSTGRILENQVEDIRMTGIALEVKDGMKNWKQIFALSEGPKWKNVALEKSFTELIGREGVWGKSTIGLVESRVLPKHRKFDAIAALSKSDLVLIDSLGQLWHQHVGDREIQFVDQVGIGAKFGIEDSAEQDLIVSIGVDRFQLKVIGGKVVLSKILLGKLNVLPDFTYLGGAIQFLNWNSSTGMIPIKFSLEFPGSNIIPIQAIGTGFNCFAVKNLCKVDSKLHVQTQTLLAPVIQNHIDWMSSRLYTNSDIEPPSSPEVIPKAPVALSDGTSIRFTGKQVSAFVGIEEFLFDGRRFACDSCNAATIQEGKLVTATTDGRLIERTIEGALLPGTLRFNNTSIIPLPEGSRTLIRLAPSDDLQSVLAGDARATWKRVGTQWQIYKQDTFLPRFQTKWTWERGTRQFKWDKQIYELEPNSSSFPCDRMALKNTANLGHYLAICNQNGSISYRGMDGRWYAISTQNRMPTIIAQPMNDLLNRDDIGVVGCMSVGRRSQGGNPPEVVFDLINEKKFRSSFIIHNGVLEGVDNWLATEPLELIDKSSLIVRCKESQLERTLTFADRGGSKLSPPLLFQVRKKNQDCIPLKEGSGFQLTTTSCTLTPKQKSKVDFGIPSQSGFKLLDPLQISPLGLSLNGVVYWAQGQKLYCRNKGGSPLDITFVSSTPTAIQGRGVMPQNRLWQLFPDGISRLYFSEFEKAFDQSIGQFVALPAMPAKTPCLADGDAASLVATVVKGGGLRISRSKPQNRIEIYLRPTPEGGTAFDHQINTTRITCDADSIHTFSNKWKATYRSILGNNLELSAVEAITPTKDPRLNLPFQFMGKLSAKYSVDGYKFSAEDGTPYPLGSLIGPTRVFVQGDHVIEADNGWWRIRQINGTILKRGKFNPLNFNDVYRVGDQLISSDVAWKLDSKGGIIEELSKAPYAQPRLVDQATVAPWEVRLDKVGDMCGINYDQRPLALKDGALDIDYAITAAACDANVTLVDRGGLEWISFAGDMSKWSSHSVEIAAQAQSFMPITTLGWDDGRRVRGFSKPDDKKQFQIPETSAGRLIPVLGSEVAHVMTSTEGSKLRATLDTNKLARFVRTYISTSGFPRQFSYPPIRLAEAITRGSFAFDYPDDLICTSSEESLKEQLWVKFKYLQNEIYEALDEQGQTIDLTLTAPKSTPNKFDQLNPEWIRGDEIIVSSSDPKRIAEISTTVERSIGKPLLWFRRGSRIFVFGRSDAGWIEMSPRWKRSPLKD